MEKRRSVCRETQRIFDMKNAIAGEEKMTGKNMSRFVMVKMYVSDDCKGRYMCSRCGTKKSWNGENYTEMRCINLKCNSIMKLKFEE